MITIDDSIEAIAAAVRSGQVSAVSLAKESLRRAEAAVEYNSLIHINHHALERAAQVDAQVAAGELTEGLLAGVPFIAKDNFLTKGIETTAAANILKGFIPPYSATSIAKLEAEGAVLIGKANLDAFAHGSSTENSHFGPTLNPLDTSKVPGGSSGGSGAAVALNIAPFALGTDTGGSIRLPASFCGVVGYKPTYGLVSRNGVIAMASSTDVIGPLARTVADAGYVLNVIAGRDSLDSTTIDRPSKSYVPELVSLQGLKVGVVSEYLGDGLSDEVRESVTKSIAALKSAGATIIDVSLPMLEYALGCYYIIVPAEISSNLSRYDGVRYGAAVAGSTLDEGFELTRSEGFHKENQRRIMIGTYVLSHGYYDAYYKKAQSVRTLLIEDFVRAFESCDILLGPTSPSTAFGLGENTTDPLQMYLADIMTVAVNLVGIPAISIPSPNPGAMPVGLQLMAPSGADQQLLNVASALEKELA